jgi:hypothetical protein
MQDAMHLVNSVYIQGVMTMKLISPPSSLILRHIIKTKNGSGSDTHGIEFEEHLLPYFKSNTDMNLDILEYECKTDTSDSDSNSDIYSIYRITVSYFLY